MRRAVTRSKSSSGPAQYSHFIPWIETKEPFDSKEKDLRSSWEGGEVGEVVGETLALLPIYASTFLNPWMLLSELMRWRMGIKGRMVECKHEIERRDENPPEG